MEKCTICGSDDSTLKAPHINNGKTICLRCVDKEIDKLRDIYKSKHIN